jgi:glycerol uptake facilitator-like aquaporin
MDQSLPLARRAAAEGIATFALVFAGCGAIVTDAHYHGALGAVGVSLVFGLIIMVMVYATGHLSGAHINPAVTVAFAVNRHFPTREAAAYVGAQLVGATSSERRRLAHLLSSSRSVVVSPTSAFSEPSIRRSATGLSK